LVFDGTNVGTLGASGVSARVYDELQFTLGEGPCLDSVAHRAPVVVVDLADPDVVRWPAYGPAMLADQIRGVYAMPVVVAGQYGGALDLFGSPRRVGCRAAGRCVGGGRAGPDAAAGSPRRGFTGRRC